MQSATLTVNLKKKLVRMHTSRRRKRAVGLITEAVARFTKTDPNMITVHKDLNAFIQRNASGASFLWAKMKVDVEKLGEGVRIKLPGTKTEIKTETKSEAKAEKKEEAKTGARAEAPKAAAPKALGNKQNPQEKPKKA